MTQQTSPLPDWRAIGHRGPKVGGIYDRFVRVMRVALPVLSLVLLLAVLIWPMINSQEMSFVLSKDRVEVSPERLRMEQPHYRGTDAQGRPFEISARRAVQRTSATPVVELVDVAARMTLTDDAIQVTAAKGSYDLEKEQLKVTGPLVLQTERGYRFATRNAVVDLPSKTAYGSDGIEGTGPLGSFKAKSFRADVDAQRVVFRGGTHMRIVPRP